MRVAVPSSVIEPGAQADPVPFVSRPTSAVQAIPQQTERVSSERQPQQSRAEEEGQRVRCRLPGRQGQGSGAGGAGGSAGGGRSVGSRVLRVLKWLLIFGTRQRGDPGGHRVLRLPQHRDPRRQQGLPGAVQLRLLLRRQGQRQDRSLRGAEPAVDPAGRHPAGDAGRRHRRGGPHLLQQQGHRPPGDRPGRVLQRPGQLHPGRLDDHPAVRQDPLPQPGTDAVPQGQGGVPLPEGAAAAVQVGDPRGLPEHHLLRSWRVRRAGRGQRLLRQAGQEADRPGGGDALRDPELAELPQARAWRTGPRRPDRALRLRAARDGLPGHARLGRRPSSSTASCPSWPSSGPTTCTAASAASC